MSESRFGNGHYKDALQYAKDVLSSSSSIDEIVANANIKEENVKDLEKENK
jgi:cell division protein FtsB